MKVKWKDFNFECTVDEFEDLFTRGVFDPNLITGVKRETVHDNEGSHIVPVYGCQIPVVSDIPNTPAKDEPKCVIAAAPEKHGAKVRDEFARIMDEVHYTLDHSTASWNIELKTKANIAYVDVHDSGEWLNDAKVLQYLVSGCAHITGDVAGAYVVEKEQGTTYIICNGFPDRPQHSMLVTLFKDQDDITGANFQIGREGSAKPEVLLEIGLEPGSPLALFAEACTRRFPMVSPEEHERIAGERLIAEESIRCVEAAGRDADKKTNETGKSGVSYW